MDDPGRETGVWRARRGGRPVAMLRCVEVDTWAQIECETYPADDTNAEPFRPGPYRFASTAEAMSFVGEAMLALEYLGCDFA